MKGTKNVSAEFNLIALCCRTAIDVLSCRGRPDPGMVSRINEIISGSGSEAIDPAGVIEMCRRHNVGPMMFRGLKSLSRSGAAKGMNEESGRPVDNERECGSGVDRENRSCLERLLSDLELQYLANVLRNERLQIEVCGIAEWFAAAGIRAVPFKGPVMSWQLYGDVALRPLSDIDFVLHKDDLVRAKDLLEAKGFRSLREMTEAEDRVWRRAGWGYDLHNPTGEFTVDMAAGATPDYLPCALSPDRFWNETREIDFNGRKLRVMSPELLLIFLCWHGAKHLWEKLIWVADVQALMMQKPGLDWFKVQRLVRESGTGRMVETGLGVARRVFGEERGQRSEFRDRLALRSVGEAGRLEGKGQGSGFRGQERADKGQENAVQAGSDQVPRCAESRTSETELPIPNTEHRTLKPSFRLPPDLVETCLRRLMRGADANTGWFGEQVFYLRMRETIVERFWYVMRTIFRPTISDCRAVRLPSRLFGLYYLVRPFRLALKVAKKAGHRL